VSECMRCRRTLKNDEIALFKKLVNRGAEKYMCINCLAEHFAVSVSDLEEKIEQYKKMGCTLFK